MAVFQKILAATDFSEVSTGALRCAAAMAASFGASLTVAHVAEDLGEEAVTAGVGTSWSVGPQTKVEAEATVRLANVVQKLAAEGLDVRSALLVGHPVSEILNYAEHEKFDLIVMGTHGRRAIARVLLGSVAESVVRMAPCPVLTVRACRQEQATF
jgi:nucleotide-binding universal stress UspA family protein